MKKGVDKPFETMVAAARPGGYSTSYPGPYLRSPPRGGQPR